MAKYLSKREIIDAQDLLTEDVEVPEWGGTVRVKMMTGLEKDDFEAEQVTVKVVGKSPKVDIHLENKSARLAARCIVDESGARLFDDDEIMALANKSAAALARVVSVAQRLNKISDKDVKELVETLKNDQPAG